MYLKVYCREIMGKIYPASLADSVHLAYSQDKIQWKAVNRNLGILFAEATIGEKNQIQEKGVSDVGIFTLADGGFGIYAYDFWQDKADSRFDKSSILIWQTKDFIWFSPETRWLLESNVSIKAAIESRYPIKEWADNGIITVTDQLGEQMIDYWGAEETECVSEGQKSGESPWNPDTGGYPMTQGYGDPVIFYWEGTYYFTATNDKTKNIGIYVRSASTIESLFAEECVEHLILAPNQQKGYVRDFWAPEFHEIKGRIYILFAVSGTTFSPQSYMMRFKEGGDICCSCDWEEPVRVQKMDGTYLADGTGKGDERKVLDNEITLDMTYFEVDQASYLVWSYRKGIMTDEDSGSMLLIATVDPECPWKLTSDPKLLSRPLYGWENNSGTINNEGPYALVREDRVCLIYSGGAASGNSYVVGLMSIPQGKNLLESSNWEKRTAPILTSFHSPGEYGPGHGAVFEDAQGTQWLTYHAQPEAEGSIRCVGIKRVLWNKWGEPYIRL